MIIWWITTIGIVLCLGLTGGIMVYGLKGALDTDDSTYIDPLPEEKSIQK
jgi:hypothetical protein